MNKQYEEQLLENTDVNLVAVEQNEEKMDEEVVSGSSIKKFKTVEALEKAYENLEKEFTKKCQKLNELLCENNKEVLPQYKQEDWLNKVSKFIAENKNAKNYTKEIADVLINDETLAKKEDALSLAYSIVLDEKFKTGEELINDSNFLNEYVFNNEKIKKKIIEEYVNSLDNNKSVPLISISSGTSSVSSPRFMPKNLKEAGRYAEQILKK